MTKLFPLLASLLAVLACSCAVWVGGPLPEESTDTPEDTSTTRPPTRFAFSTSSLFPFEDNTNWWMYTESGSNTVIIEVTDTISDDGTIFYRVSFKENRVDTTDDWFQREFGEIRFGPSLRGNFDLFLPAMLDSVKGRFVSASSTVDYAFYDTRTVGTTVFRRVVLLQYSTPILHGFRKIAFADGVGIVQLTDENSRWPVVYELDSCSVDGAVRRYE